MRDYVLVAFVVASIPVGLVLPYYAMLVYAWISYMVPHMYTWSFGQTFPSAKLMAGTAIAGALINKDVDTAPLRRPESIAMMLLWICFTVSTLFAIYPTDAWVTLQDVSKVIIMALVSSVLLTTRKRMRYFLIVVTLSLAFYGIKGGLFSIATGGEQMVGGGGHSSLAANNAVGLALNMCLPFIWFLASEERGLLKRLLQIGGLLTIPAILFTYSRASALTLGVVLPVLLLKGRRTALLIAVLVIGGILAVPYVPQKWWDRQQTTVEYQGEASAMSRLDTWDVCWRVALDHPLTGAGFEFQTNELFASYSPDFLLNYGHAYNTHNIYLGILATHGFPAFFIWVAMIGFTWIGCRRVKRHVRRRDDLKWLTTYCDIVTVSLLAFLINGAFVNMEYFDLPYHLVAITASLNVICDRALASKSEQTVESTGIFSPVPA